MRACSDSRAVLKFAQVLGQHGATWLWVWGLCPLGVLPFGASGFGMCSLCRHMDLRGTNCDVIACNEIYNGNPC